MADIEKIESELRANLDDATKGPWRPGHLANDDHSCDCGFVFDCQDRMGSIATVNMDDGGQFGKEYPSRDEAKANLKHIARCSPDNIRALLGELSRLRRALKPFAKRAKDATGPGYMTTVKDEWLLDAARVLSERKEGQADG